MADCDDGSILAAVHEIETIMVALGHAVSTLRSRLTSATAPSSLDDIAHAVSRAVTIPLEPFSGHPIADENTLAIHWHGKVCSVGPVLPFRLFLCLAQRSNHYLTHEDLIEQVWGKSVSREAIRSVVCDLRARLARAHMRDLAALIDGRYSGRYALLLNHGSPC